MTSILIVGAGAVGALLGVARQGPGFPGRYPKGASSAAERLNGAEATNR